MKIRTLLLFIGVLFTAFSVNAADIEAGKTKSAICVSCHGANGISPNDLWPNLAGQKEGYLVAQIKAFRDDVRVNAMMKPMVANLTDQDVADIAAFYASLK